MINQFLVAFLVPFLVLAVIGFSLPKDCCVEQSELFSDDAAIILDLTSDLKAGQSRSAWNKRAASEWSKGK
jgi:hypothetical protein